MDQRGFGYSALPLQSPGIPARKPVPVQYASELSSQYNEGYSPLAHPRRINSGLSSRFRLLKAVGTLLLAIFITVFTIGVVFFKILIARTANLSSIDLTIYSMCLTFAATICSTLILSTLQRLLIHRMNESIRHSLSSTYAAQELLQEESKWRTVLRIASLPQKLSNWHTFLVYTSAALVTTAVVSACTATVTPVSTKVPSAYPVGDSNVCTQVDVPPWEISGCYPVNYWILPNGSFVTQCQSANGCPTRQAVTLAGTINTVDPSSYAYADLGVAVTSSAIGAPSTIYSPDSTRAKALAANFAHYGQGLTNFTQCAPVLARNPVSCRPGGTLSYKEYTMTVISSDGGCNATESFQYDLEEYNAGAVVSWLCTHGDVGRATIVMGATWGWGGRLAQTLNDQEYLSKFGASGTAGGYVLTCTIDAAPAIEKRMVSLEMQIFDPEGSGYSKTLHGTGEPCAPEDDHELGPAYPAYVAMATWQLLLQNYGNGGWFETINEIANAQDPHNWDNEFPRNVSDLAFSNSKNALEDVFRLLGGLMMSRMNSTMLPVTAEVTSQYYRVGGGHRFAFVYAAPSGICAFAIAWLLLSAPRMKGEVYLRTDHLLDLFQMGRIMGR